MGASSHTLDRVEVTFDGDRMVADAGLILPATLSQHLGVEALVDELVSVGHRPGRKLLTVVHALLAGGDCIDDADILRSGATSEVVGHEVMAPSTIGTWLRSFTFGHVRQLDALTERLLTAAWAAGAGPGAAPLVIDVDSTICQTHGYAKQGATYGYTRQRGYHPLLATRADTGEILHARMRKGSANSSRGAQRFVRETIRRVRRAGATGPIVLRADSAFGRPRSSPRAGITTCASPSPCVPQRPSLQRSTASTRPPGSTSTTPMAASPRSPRRRWRGVG
jgi:hypothetical protein